MIFILSFISPRFIACGICCLMLPGSKAWSPSLECFHLQIVCHFQSLLQQVFICLIKTLFSLLQFFFLFFVVVACLVAKKGSLIYLCVCVCVFFCNKENPSSLLRRSYCHLSGTLQQKKRGSPPPLFVFFCNKEEFRLLSFLSVAKRNQAPLRFSFFLIKKGDKMFFILMCINFQISTCKNRFQIIF
jgi:hypothetical protein